MKVLFRIGDAMRRHHILDDPMLIMIIIYALSALPDVICFTPSHVAAKTIYPIKHQETATPVRTHALQPETNPYANPDTVSLSGVKYQNVFNGLLTLYPPNTLEERNAMSRTDAYWPYIQKGLNPPTELTYGEFDFYFFAEKIIIIHS